MSQLSSYTVGAWQQEVADLETAVKRTDREIARLRGELATELEARKQCAARAYDLRGLLRDVSPELAEKYPEPQDGTGEPDPRRDGLIDGMRQLADYLETNPQIPTPFTSSPLDVHIYTSSRFQDDAAEDEAEVDRIAALMGVTACRPKPNNHYEGVLGFGKYVQLEVVSTAGSNLKWKPGDPMPSGIPAEVAAKYAPTPESEPTAHDAATCLDCAGYDTAEDDVPAGQCGKRAVDIDGATGCCIRSEGHTDPTLAGYDGTQSEHFDPAFGVWDDGGTRLKLDAKAADAQGGAR